MAIRGASRCQITTYGFAAGGQLRGNVVVFDYRRGNDRKHRHSRDGEDHDLRRRRHQLVERSPKSPSTANLPEPRRTRRNGHFNATSSTRGGFRTDYWKIGDGSGTAVTQPAKPKKPGHRHPRLLERGKAPWLESSSKARPTATRAAERRTHRRHPLTGFKPTVTKSGSGTGTVATPRPGSVRRHLRGRISSGEEVELGEVPDPAQSQPTGACSGPGAARCRCRRPRRSAPTAAIPNSRSRSEAHCSGTSTSTAAGIDCGGGCERASTKAPPSPQRGL